MGISHTHHYIPQSLIKRWEVGGRYHCLRRVTVEKVVTEKPKNGTSHIHSIEWLNEAIHEGDRRDILEADFLKRPDDIFAKVVEDLVVGRTPTEGLSSFPYVCSLIFYRHPIEFYEITKLASQQPLVAAANGYLDGWRDKLIKLCDAEEIRPFIENSSINDAYRYAILHKKAYDLSLKLGEEPELVVIGNGGAPLLPLADGAFMSAVLPETMRPVLMFPASPEALVVIGTGLPERDVLHNLPWRFWKQSFANTSTRIVLPQLGQYHSVALEELASAIKSEASAPFVNVERVSFDKTPLLDFTSVYEGRVPAPQEGQNAFYLSEDGAGGTSIMVNPSAVFGPPNKGKHSDEP